MTQHHHIIHDIFFDHFEIRHANSESLLDHAYRLRHEVFVEGKQYFESSEDELETDIYDSHSLHFLLYHKQSGEPIGTVRLILPDKQDLEHSFKVQEYCDFPELHDSRSILCAAEISRFCLSRHIRKKMCGTVPISLSHIHDIPHIKDEYQLLIALLPLAPIGMLSVLLETALEQDIQKGFSLVEPYLLRLLGRYGVKMTVIGKSICYCGNRIPVTVDPATLCDTVREKNEEIWNLMTDNGRLDDLAHQHPC